MNEKIISSVKLTMRTDGKTLHLTSSSGPFDKLSPSQMKALEMFYTALAGDFMPQDMVEKWCSVTNLKTGLPE